MSPLWKCDQSEIIQQTCSRRFLRPWIGIADEFHPNPDCLISHKDADLYSVDEWNEEHRTSRLNIRPSLRRHSPLCSHHNGGSVHNFLAPVRAIFDLSPDDSCSRFALQLLGIVLKPTDISIAEKSRPQGIPKIPQASFEPQPLPIVFRVTGISDTFLRLNRNTQASMLNGGFQLQNHRRSSWISNQKMWQAARESRHQSETFSPSKVSGTSSPSASPTMSGNVLRLLKTF